MLAPLLLLAFLLLLNGLFALSELAVMTSRHGRLQQAARAGGKGAAAALRLAREPTRFLSTVQVGITLIGVLAGAYGEKALSGHLEPLVASVPLLAPAAGEIALGIVVIAITYCWLVFGELVPKRVALAHPEAAASAIARPLHALSVVAAWPVRLLSASTDLLLRALRVRPPSLADVSEDDVRSMIASAASTGVFTPQELKVFQRTMRAGDLVVRDLMVPRTDVVWIDAGQDMEGVRVLVGTSPHSHFPVCNGDLDQLVGVVHIRDLVAYGLATGENFKVGVVAHKPLFVPESMPALRLLDQFQGARNHVAMVVDEYGSIQGLLTLNDVTRAIVGEVSRTGDAGYPSMHRRDEHSWLVDGRLPLHELVLGLNLSAEAEAASPDVSTVGGLVTTMLGHFPDEGESIVWQGHRIEVVDLDGHRVDKLLVTAQADELPGPS